MNIIAIVHANRNVQYSYDCTFLYNFGTLTDSHFVCSWPPMHPQFNKMSPSKGINDENGKKDQCLLRYVLWQIKTISNILILILWQIKTISNIFIYLLIPQCFFQPTVELPPCFLQPVQEQLL